MGNAEIGNIVKIMGLKYGKKYETDDEVKTLRYGRLMIMTDQVVWYVKRDIRSLYGRIVNDVWLSMSQDFTLVMLRAPVLQDHDGSHIKGLLINFIHSNWPNMLQRRCVRFSVTEY